MTYDKVDVGNLGGRYKFEMKVGDICYNIVSVNNGTCSDGDFGFEISIEDGEKNGGLITMMKGIKILVGY